MTKKSGLEQFAGILAGVGALNWGLVEFMELNLVDSLLGSIEPLGMIAYGLVGVSGLIVLKNELIN